MNGQCAVSHFGLDSLQRNVTINDIVFTPGGYVAVGRPQLIPPAPQMYSSWGPDRGVAVVGADSTGVQTWYRLLLPTNPDIEMDAYPRVEPTSEGGVVVYGDLRHTRFSSCDYTNQYLVKLDGAGQVEWSRIYMMPDSMPINAWGNRSASLKALANGELAWGIDGSTELYHVTLDPHGWPLTARAYKDTNAAFGNESRSTNIRPDGSWTRAYWCDSTLLSRQAGLIVVDANGQVLWARHMHSAVVPSYDVSALNCANGDIVVSWEKDTVHQLARFDGNGQLLWNRWVEHAYYLRERPNGSILGVVRGGEGGSYVVGLISSDGSTIEHVRKTGWSEHLWPFETNGEAMALVSMNIGPCYTPRVMLVSDYGALAAGGCGYAPLVSLPTTLEPVAPLPVTIDTDTAVIKTWDLSLHDLNDDTLDLAASLSGTAFRVGYGGVFVGSVANLSTIGSPVTTVTLETSALTTISLVTPPPTSIVGNLIT